MFGNKKEERREKLLSLIKTHFPENSKTYYGEIAALIKKEAPGMYHFHKGALNHLSDELIGDLKILEERGMIRENNSLDKGKDNYGRIIIKNTRRVEAIV